MIYTVTFNPALDYVVKVDNFTTGTVNRTVSEEIFYGGKGINVSAVLKEQKWLVHPTEGYLIHSVP